MNDFSEKQLQIMDCALSIFSEKGFDSTSVRDIAHAARINVAMISYYFGSKEKLLEAIFKNHIARMKLKIETILSDNELDPCMKIDRLVDMYVDVVVTNRRFSSLIVREQVLLKDGPLYRYVRDMKKENIKLIRAAITAGQRQGYFQKNIDVHMLSITLFGSVHHVFTNYKFMSEQYRVPADDEAAFGRIVIHKLRDHIKCMFKSFLTYGISKD